ncbi:MAG: precorrin-6y C5,15-methyltransferase (decarboxylating) subunit CbiE [Thermodesulfobacteria bacterium]|nr:precorrin-6y C5,15-methyltransferase (decarboxylating) subunit CbiE [Thermodesulfobacteriota bacterium]
MIHVVGLHHPRDLAPAVAEIVAQAEVLVGGRRHLSLFEDHPAEKIAIPPVEEALERLKALSHRRVVVLVSGDPLFFGLGRRLLRELPRDSLCFHPAPSAVQLLFSRLKIPWDDARVVSLHGRSPRNLHLEIAPYGKVAFLTDPENSPPRLASYLLEKGISGKVYVGENLGLPEERIRAFDLEQVPEESFSALNVMLLLKEPSPRRLLFGLPEETFAHEGNLITKAEVRAAVVSALAPFPEATVWDLGAGSGAVGLELAALAFRGRTFLVERKPARIELIRQNLRLTRLDNVEIIDKDLRDALPSLPTPDLVFVGGGFRALLEMGPAFLSRLGPQTRLAATFVILEHLLAALEFFERNGFEASFSALFLARGKRFPDGGRGLLAENPVFLLRARRPE